MRVGLYFGSFNPVHNGHLLIANYAATETTLDQVWFVVSPQNPFKQEKTLLNEYHRLHLISLALEGETRIKASNVEFSLPKPSYTCDTLIYLSERYPTYEFSIIMGSDGFQNLTKWKNYQTLIENHKIYIYKRSGFEVTETFGAQLQILEAPLLEISSTQIRKRILDKKSIRYWVPDVVKNEIEIAGYYK
jgi:nicotinate-nucleotide adenylyltransferase